jgi:ATP-dependent DNA helicase RecQ
MNPNVAYWATVCRKIIQRGDTPPVPPLVETALRPRRTELETSDVALLTAAVGPSESVVELDDCYRLHPQWEKPFWDATASRLPGLTRWLTPQPSLESLAGAAAATSRWTDFLLATPWDAPDLVIEIDGSGHARRRGVDRDRDRLLAQTRLSIERHAGPSALDPEEPLARALQDVWQQRPTGDPDPALLVLLHGPPAFHRLAFSLVEAVERGALEANRPWVVALADPLGVAASLGGEALSVLGAIDDVWGTGVVPDEVVLGTTTWRRNADGRFESAGESKVGADAALTIRLEPFTPPHQRIPNAAEPTVVVRSACLPVSPEWALPTSSERRTVVNGVRFQRGVGRLAETLFGHPWFRPGQREALAQILAGGDCVVLLPTGAGKSLIYQLAGLLQPGTTLIVDPITSLIDDQERRLLDEGIDRVDGIHMARLGDRRDEVYRRFASGATLFAFLTPERFQSAEFRGYLRQAAADKLVNLAVIDEAHCVSEWGHDFRTSYLRLGRNLRTHAAGDDDVPPPLLALTGTASPAVLRDVLHELAIDPSQPGVLQRPADFDRPNLRYLMVPSTPATWKADFRAAIQHAIPGGLNCDGRDLAAPDGDTTRSGLVFVPHVNWDFGVLNVALVVCDALDVSDRSLIDVYCGQKPKAWAGRRWDEHKVAAARGFIDNELPVLVATKAFGMGIDKANIRWTLHAALTSSIEAFAQEAGRAGRDGAVSMCVLVAALPPVSSAERLLDLKADRPTRQARYQAGGGSRDSLQQQLYFLYNSYPGEEQERTETVALYRELEAEGAAPTRQVVIPRIPAEAVQPSEQGAAPTRREKALYRLSLLGLIFDYTIEHGANTFSVELADYTPDRLDAEVLALAQRVDPGRQDRYEAEIAGAPAQFGPRLAHHLAIVLRLIYQKVELGRLNALRDMYRLVADNLDDAGIRSTINGYLGEGPISSALSEAIRAAVIDVPAVLAVLDAVTRGDPYEWAAAADRMLESYPGHPVLLLVRALGEAWKPSGTGDRTEFIRQVHALADSLPAYGVVEGDAARVFTWAMTQLRGGARWSWCSVLWEAWDRTGYTDSALCPLEDQVLREAQRGNHHPDELMAVATRRLRRHSMETGAYADKVVSGTGRGEE